MEFKKCNRCGNFFISSNTDICYDCSVKDKKEIAKLNNIINNSDITSIQELSMNSGVKEININRFIENKFIEL